MDEIEISLGHMEQPVQRHGGMRENEGLSADCFVRMKNEFGIVVGDEAEKTGKISCLWDMG